MEIRPIPAFYCCYLLRSTVRHSSLYVGSTPNPVRRLAQHNGQVKGGAVRTSKESLRPWEMVCIVSGFPSNIAALQFEWAWQNTHITRRIPPEQRITAAYSKVTKSSRTGRTRRKPARPRMSLTDKLSNLHLLLRVHSFARWPLEARFFSEDVYDVWKRWAERVDGQIRDGIKISLDVKPTSSTESELPDKNAVCSQARSKSKIAVGKGGLEGLDLSYGLLKAPVEKGLFMLADGEDINCGVCNTPIGHDAKSALLCPERGCILVSHLTCLSKTFLAQEGVEGAIVPTEGNCPGCNAKQKWVDLVKGRSLRTRGQTEVEKMMKKPKERKTKAVKRKKQVSAILTAEDPEAENDNDNDKDDDDIHQEEVETYEHDETNDLQARDMADVPINDDEWYYREDESDDNVSVVSESSGYSVHSAVPSPTRSRRQQGKKLEVVIEDSDWDDALVLD
ncbi:MAG: hypothetical protein M1812_001453 [Candelaria pacifica]|nr:MAG: hypothetical protein M1812_001453 [Candelaria pacifica]